MKQDVLIKNFNSSVFLSKANYIIKNMYESIASGNLDRLKTIVSSKIYNKYINMINKANAESTKLVYKDISVDSEIKEVKVENGKPLIYVTSICNYIKYYSDFDGRVVRGDNENSMKVVETFIFSKNSNSNSDSEVYYCSGCGSSYNFYENELCPVCGAGRECFDDYIIEDMECNL